MATSGRSGVVETIRARLPEITRSTVDAVRDAIPAYRNLHGAQLADVESITSWVLLRVLRAWVDGTGFDDGDRARFRAIGAARAEDGRAITAVLRAYRVAAITATDTVREIGRDHLDTDDVGDLTAVLLTALDELSEALMSGHTAARDRIGGDRGRARRDLLDDLLVGHQSSVGALADRSRELDVDLPGHPVLLVVEPADPGPAIGFSAVAGLAPSGGLATVHGRRGVVLLAGPVPVELDQACAERGWRGCVLSDHPITATPTAFRLASDALDAAPEHAFAGRVLIRDGDAHLLALLGARPGADPAAVVRTVLGQLTDPAHRHLLDGLAAFLATGSATAAATRLHLHPQTMRYRLRRAHDLVDRDPHDPWQRLVLDVACQLHQVRDGRARSALPGPADRR